MFKVFITPKQASARLMKDKPALWAVFDKGNEAVVALGLKIYKEEAPVLSGTLRESIRVLSRRTIKNTFDHRATIRFGPTVSYAPYPDYGVGSSQGRYVAALGKRVSTGIHPGQKAQHYTERASNRLDQETGPLINRIFGREWVQYWRRVLR